MSYVPPPTALQPWKQQLAQLVPELSLETKAHEGPAPKAAIIGGKPSRARVLLHKCVQPAAGTCLLHKFVQPTRGPLPASQGAQGWCTLWPSAATIS